MKAESYSKCPKDREGAISVLNAAIEALDLAKTSSTTPVKTVFCSFAILLTTIRVSFLFSSTGLLRIYPCLELNGQRTGLRPTRIILHRCVSGA